MKSIIQEKENQYCFVCAILREDYSPKLYRQEHHCIHGKKNLRSLSEHYGLKVYLCDRHHTYDQGPEAVHRNSDIDLIVKKAAQYAFMLRYPELEFKDIFGKNYLEPYEIPVKIQKSCDSAGEIQDSCGFQKIEGITDDNIDAFGNLLHL